VVILTTVARSKRDSQSQKPAVRSRCPPKMCQSVTEIVTVAAGRTAQNVPICHNKPAGRCRRTARIVIENHNSIAASHPKEVKFALLFSKANLTHPFESLTYLNFPHFRNRKKLKSSSGLRMKNFHRLLLTLKIFHLRGRQATRLLAFFCCPT